MRKRDDEWWAWFAIGTWAVAVPGAVILFLVVETCSLKPLPPAPLNHSYNHGGEL